MVAPERLATYDDLLGLGEDVRGEIVAGQIVTSPAPLPRHSKAQRAIGRFIGGPYDDDDGHGGPGGWWIIRGGRRPPFDPRRRASRCGRLAARTLPRPGNLRPIEVTPDWVCEVSSPSTAARDRVTKRNVYASHGVPHFWIVDPEARTLEALELHEGRWVELGAWDESAVVRVAPFEEVALDLHRLFLPRDADEAPES